MGLLGKLKDLVQDLLGGGVAKARGASASLDEGPTSVAPEMVDGLFEHSRGLFASGQSPWSIDDVCRWTYFFFDVDPAKLAEVGAHLASLGYERMEVEPYDDDEGGLLKLQVDKVERHTPESLKARNRELTAIADRFGIERFDGMEVGAVDGP